MHIKGMFVFALIGLIAAGTAIAEQPPVVPDWQQRAEQRIDEHRKGDFAFNVVDEAGKPIEGATVTAKMTRHAFKFGTAMRADLMAKIEDPDDPYLKHAAELFNHGTFGNRFKWRWQERAKHRRWADAALAWMNDHGWTVHAHVMVWATLKYGPPLPEDVEAKLKSDAPDRGQYAHRRALEHINEIGRYYAGHVEEWDVVNEHFSEHVITEAMYGDDVPLEQPPALVEWFKAARVADPHARLFVNDFGILVGDQKEHKDSYEKLIRYLIDQAAPVGGIGMQAHYVHAGQRRTPEQLMTTLDRFAAFGVPIQITEFDMFGPGWGETPEQIEAAHADYMRRFYTVCFSHPAVNGITMWGFWDGRHWQNSAPLFRKDWTPKPGYHVYRDLVFDQWWTDEQGATDAAGRWAVRGFFGTYEVRATVGDKTVTRQVRLTGPAQTITLIVNSD